MTNEELKAMLDEFKAGLPKGMSVEEVKAAIDGKFNELSKTIEGLSELKSTVETMKAGIVEFEAKVEKMGNTQKQTIEDVVAKAVVAKQSEIMSVLKSGSGIVTIDVTKEVANITTANGTIPVTAPVITGVQQAGISNVNLRNLSVEGFMTTLPTDLAAYPYSEVYPKDGDFTFVNEGAVKPQMDFEWKTRWAEPKKIAAWMKLTEESVKDVRGLESVARDILRKKHDLKKSKALLFATGTGDEPKGATKYGRTFVAGSMDKKIPVPNFMDIVNACIVDIATTHNYEDEIPYIANLVMVNSVDFFLNVVSAKTEEGVPLYPTASLFNQITIGGVTIVPDESIPAGKIFVADLSKYNITNYVPYVVKVGWVNDDFIKNQFVILAESRFHQFVKKLDEQAFIYDDIATIKTAITAPLVVSGE